MGWRSRNFAITPNISIGKSRYVLDMCRFVPEKNLHHLVEAFARTDAKDCKLVLAGDTDFEDDYSRRLKETAEDPSHLPPFPFSVKSQPDLTPRPPDPCLP